jgi:hypothetical protein
MCNDKGDWLGTQCAADTDCPTSPNCTGKPICATSAGKDPVFQGGPSNGYCTMACQSSGDCPGVANICLKPANATEGRCVLGCTLGNPDLMYLNDPLDAFKCQGREDVACSRLKAGDVCMPTCGNDTECPMGRYCNLEAGICVDGPKPTGTKLGMSCDPMAMTNPCANGFCIGSGAGKPGFCTGVCPLGGDINYGDCGGVENGLCLYFPVISGCPAGKSCVGAGDQGFCGGGCKAHDECGAPELWCRTILKGGPVGYCVGEDPCPADGGACPTGTVCTQTTKGDFCLDPAWPLGTLTPPPPDGGTDGGGGGMMDAGADAPSDAPDDGG